MPFFPFSLSLNQRLNLLDTFKKASLLILQGYTYIISYHLPATLCVSSPPAHHLKPFGYCKKIFHLLFRLLPKTFRLFLIKKPKTFVLVVKTAYLCPVESRKPLRMAEKNNIPTNPNREIIQSFLITAARYSFSVYEKRVLSCIISCLQPLLEGKKLRGRVERSLWGDYFVELPIEYFTRDDYDHLNRYKIALRSLAQKGIEVETKKEWAFYNLIQSPRMEKGSGLVRFSICSEMVDLFLNFSKGYSKFILSISLSLRSTASARLYELISNQPRPITYTISKLKVILSVDEKYTQNHAFIKKVIEVSRQELDKTANWSFTYEVKKTGKAFTHITLIPINIPKREPDEVTRAEAIRQVSVSQLVKLEVGRFLRNTCGFTPREIKNNEKTINAFCKINPDFSIDTLAEIWARASIKLNPKAYLIKALQLEIEENK